MDNLHANKIIMQKQKTIYHLVVDKSGSMSDCIEQTISGFNEQVIKICALQNEYPDQEITIGLTTFNDEVHHHFFQSPPELVKKLHYESYMPNGTTALLDAIGMTVNIIEKEIINHSKESNTTVVIVIITDGHENSSKEFNLADIKKKISRLEETSQWTFSFLGATIDAVDVAKEMSIKSRNSFVFSKANMKAGLFDRLSSSMENYMSKKTKGKGLDDLFSE